MPNSEQTVGDTSGLTPPVTVMQVIFFVESLGNGLATAGSSSATSAAGIGTAGLNALSLAQGLDERASGHASLAALLAAHHVQAHDLQAFTQWLRRWHSATMGFASPLASMHFLRSRPSMAEYGEQEEEFGADAPSIADPQWGRSISSVGPNGSRSIMRRPSDQTRPLAKNMPPRGAFTPFQSRELRRQGQSQPLTSRTRSRREMTLARPPVEESDAPQAGVPENDWDRATRTGLAPVRPAAANGAFAQAAIRKLLVADLVMGAFGAGQFANHDQAVSPMGSAFLTPALSGSFARQQSPEEPASFAASASGGMMPFAPAIPGAPISAAPIAPAAFAAAFFFAGQPGSAAMPSAAAGASGSPASILSSVPPASGVGWSPRSEPFLASPNASMAVLPPLPPSPPAQGTPPAPPPSLPPQTLRMPSQPGLQAFRPAMLNTTPSTSLPQMLALQSAARQTQGLAGMPPASAGNFETPQAQMTPPLGPQSMPAVPARLATAFPPFSSGAATANLQKVTAPVSETNNSGVSSAYRPPLSGGVVQQFGAVAPKPQYDAVGARGTGLPSRLALTNLPSAVARMGVTHPLPMPALPQQHLAENVRSSVSVFPNDGTKDGSAGIRERENFHQIGGQVHITPEMGQITLIAPPLQVASADAEASGVATQFDWADLMAGAGPLDEGGMARLKEILPPTAQMLYPAVPNAELGTGVVNFSLAPNLLQTTLTQTHGRPDLASQAHTAARGQRGGKSPATALPGKIVPGKPPTNTGAALLSGPESQNTRGQGALAEAGGQAKRGGVLDFLGLPTRVAPSLAGKTDLAHAIAARGGSGAGAAPPARPQEFTPALSRLFPAFQSVSAEPDTGAWRAAAPSFGLRGDQPVDLLSPNSRVPAPKPSVPLPSRDSPRGQNLLQSFLPAHGHNQNAASASGSAGRPNWKYPMASGIGGAHPLSEGANVPGTLGHGFLQTLPAFHGPTHGHSASFRGGQDAARTIGRLHPSRFNPMDSGHLGGHRIAMSSAEPAWAAPVPHSTSIPTKSSSLPRFSAKTGMTAREATHLGGHAVPLGLSSGGLSARPPANPAQPSAWGLEPGYSPPSLPMPFRLPVGNHSMSPPEPASLTLPTLLPSGSSFSPRRTQSFVLGNAPPMALPSAMPRQSSPMTPVTIQRSAMGSSGGATMKAGRPGADPESIKRPGQATAANDVHLLANEVWSLLKRRLATEAERIGRR